MKGDLNRAAQIDGWQNAKFTVQFRPFSAARAEASWLRSAYLGFFAALGYRFVFRSELEIVRKRIKDPATKAFGFRIVRPERAPESLLTVMKMPEAFRSFAMIYGQHVVFLPLYGDTDLYARLAKQPSGHVEMTSQAAYSFPDRPLFLHDAQ